MGDYRVFSGNAGTISGDLGTLFCDENIAYVTNVMGANGANGVNNMIIASTDAAGDINIGFDSPDDEDTAAAIDNLTIVTGAIFSPEAGKINVAGDFTTSGGLIGKSCFDFNGASGLINCGSDSSIDNIFDSGGTVEAWINNDGNGEGGRIFEKTQWNFKTQESNGTLSKLNLYYSFNSGSNYGQWTTGFVITDGKWHHVALTYDNGATTNQPKIYVDGKQVALTQNDIPTTTRDTDAASSLYLGNRAADDRTFDGRIAMARLFSDIRTEAELRADMFSSSFSDSTCDVTGGGENTVTCDANKDIKAGQAVHADSGTPFIGTGTTVASITEGGGGGTGVTSFELSGSGSTETHSNTKLIFNRMANAGNLVAFYQFDEGTGTSLKDRTINANTGTITVGGSAWGAAGTFTYGTSTLVMSGTSKTMYYPDDFELYKFTVSGTTTLNCMTGGGGLFIKDDFTVDASKTLTSANNSLIKLDNTFRAGGALTVGTPATGIANLYMLRLEHSSGTISIPACTTARLFGAGNGGTTTATGDLTITEELELSTNHTFNANGNTINVKLLDANVGTVNLSNSALSFLSAGQLNLTYNSTLTTGNTTITGYSSGSKTTAVLPMDGNFEVVGDVKWMKMNTDADLTVVGAVIDCDTSLSGANIRQWHHTLDTQQLLDADSGNDDDLRLTKPALDNAHELMTG